MFLKFYDALHSQLCNALCVILASNSDPVKILSAAMQEIGKVLANLRTKVLSVPFPTSAIEILFFKTIKPKFYAHKIFHFELYGLDMNKPVGTVEMLIDYYKEELLALQRFFKLNAPLYQYYKTGRTELDALYFLRGAEVPTILIPEMPEPDRDFSTAMDYPFAKFMAYEMLQEEILRRISLLDGSAVPSVITKSSASIKWTGSKVNLVELIYGLYYTGQLNNGDAKVEHIVVLMEEIFGIKLSDAVHTFGEIRKRKMISPSKFLEKMAAAILQRVDEDLTYKPNRGPKLITPLSG